MTVDPASRPSSAKPRRPVPAERARTVATSPSATLRGAGAGSSPVLAHTTTADGDVLLVVPSSGAVLTAVSESVTGDLPVLLTVTDHAPVPLREPVRAQLRLSGWLTPVLPADLPTALLAFAAASAAGVLLDVGRTASLLRLDLADVVLAEGGAAVEITPEDYAAATPDPLVGVEAATLRHLEAAHPEAIAMLRAHIPVEHAGSDDVVRPLGLDRWGIRLRVEGPRGCRDVRIAFARPVACPGELGPAVQRLLCAAPRVRRTDEP